jgi:hypothetical protein
MKKNESFVEKVKAGSRSIFMGMGNVAAGNPINDSSKRGNMEPMPFSWPMFFPYETPVPKRKRK